ncbi:MAG: VanZ family protein [Haliea sp.]|uniref:VanZ family protein n=1 Tax=Haliea sp. TaxID=1932666 RepID=UPI0032EE8E08
MNQPARNPLPWLWIAYTCLLVYGTWFPLERWDWNLGGLEAFLALDRPARVPRSDFILNLIVYLPFGLLAMLCLPGGLVRRLLLATASGVLLSTVLEFGQTYLPNRVSSLADLLLNSAGSLLGALGAGLTTRLPLARRLLQSVHGALQDPASGRLGLLALSCWVLAQWAPLVPSLDIGNLRAGVAPLKASLLGHAPLEVARLTSYLLMLVAVGSLALAILAPARRRVRWLLCLTLAVLAGKVLVMGRVLSTEALLALAAAAPALWLLRRAPVSLLRLTVLLALMAFHVHDALLPAAQDTALRGMNWIPLRGHMNSVNGVVNLLATTWVFVALAWALYPWTRDRYGRALLAGAVAAAAFGLEWWQQYIPGRHPDLTDVLVAAAAWWLASAWGWQQQQHRPGAPAAFSAATGTRWRGKVTTRQLGWVAVACLLLLGGLYATGTRDQRPPYTLPADDQLPAPVFPAWREAHPRLPAPMPADVQLLQNHNPGFWAKHRRRAAAGEFYSRILLARAEPGSVDLDALHAALLALEPNWRGHLQTTPLALAYDWLYPDWSLEQRRTLLLKLEAACAYQVHAITDKYALSPYNVYLYNSPLQALMMAAIASHGDSADDHCMRFTTDYWRHRVLPVWRQVMGRQGGWHEGGEYVGIGIGQAIHRLPALWRHATGEDLFASEPGIRGFADFAVHRTRPDGTYVRLGDAAFFRRHIPDLAPLALELGHRAAYTLAKPPQLPTPLGYPWGPLSRASLADPDARQALPTSRWFDGIGLLLARSSWDPDTTFVSFRAGHNYWSHSHLDQGAFTIFSGGALAIDSGLYNRSGSDHHRIYTSQSIAHNVVTVTDPDDTVPMPPRREGDASRAIANDGGQRRVGSGWGRSAPLDYSHWYQQRDHYQTVGKVLQGDTEGVSWVVADLTPAYTNSRSGRGDFAERSRRVRHFQRSFLFDREQALVIVHDQVDSTNPAFRKKWLLHSQGQPAIAGRSFRVAVAANASTGMSGGQLLGQVLLPEDASLTAIGGPGFEYFVDGSNQDQGGTVQKAARRLAAERGAEPGAWRLELQPGLQQHRHEFLVVMRTAPLASAAEALPPMALQRVDGSLLLTVGDDRQVVYVLPDGSEPVRVQRRP